MIRQARLTVFVLVSLGVLTATAASAEFTFDIDPNQSFLAINAFVKAVDAPTVGQDDGADIASYSGTITIDLDSLEDPSEIRFLNAEAIAETTGDWLPQAEGGMEGDPGNPSPANFGIVLDAGPAGVLFGAFRDTVFTIESDDRPIIDGGFDSGQIFITSQGFLDSNIVSPVLGNSFGRDDTTGDNAENISSESGTYALNNGVATISIPIDLDFLSGSDDGVDFLFDGMMVATFGTPQFLPGDANNDGRVDAVDLNIIGLNWQQSNKVRSEGDLTGDGIVDAADLNLLGLNWQNGVAKTVVVAEPNALPLAAFAGLAALSWRKRYADR